MSTLKNFLTASPIGHLSQLSNIGINLFRPEQNEILTFQMGRQWRGRKFINNQNGLAKTTKTFDQPIRVLATPSVGHLEVKVRTSMITLQGEVNGGPTNISDVDLKTIKDIFLKIHFI